MENNINMVDLARDLCGFDDDSWHITNDKDAEFILREMKKDADECARVCALAEEMVAYYAEQAKAEQEKTEKKNAYRLHLLEEYFNTVEHRSTKTEDSYRLVSGVLKFKRPSEKIVPDEDALAEAYPDFVESKARLMWGDLKKRLTIIDGNVFDSETGEYVAGASVEEVPGKFSVRFRE